MLPVSGAWQNYSAKILFVKLIWLAIGDFSAAWRHRFLVHSSFLISNLDKLDFLLFTNYDVEMVLWCLGKVAKFCSIIIEKKRRSIIRALRFTYFNAFVLKYFIFNISGFSNREFDTRIYGGFGRGRQTTISEIIK